MIRGGGRTGMTLVEVMIAVVLVSIAAVLVYQGGFYSYKTLMRARMRLEAQGIAFDKLWQLFNMPFENLPGSAEVHTEATPAGGAFPNGGLIRYAVIPETNAPLSWIEYWEVTVQVWAPSNSALFNVMNDDGSVRAAFQHPLADYTVLRYRGER
ncbi:MAG: type II secretion system protein J [Kiritimatiellales bacterium]|jgi:prepilin-type N-terminal cleavage/methylation domain-containing protein